MKGLNNTLLKINLTNKTSEKESLPDEIFENYLGGRGLGAKLLVDNIEPRIDALSPKNIMVFATGPLTGTMVPTAGRFALVTKSPLTNGIFYSNTGGFIGYNFKRCGADALMIEGAADLPSYIVIDGEDAPNGNIKIDIKSADSLWGLDTRETLVKLKELEGDKINAVMVGPAGENLVKIAAIMNDGDHRAFGRGGVGAVMGSKKLKAIVIKNGTIRTEVDKPEYLKEKAKSAHQKLKVVPVTRSALPKFGTAGNVNIINDYGLLPTNNFQIGNSEEAKQISGEAIRENIFVKDEGCYGCPIRCGRLTKTSTMEGKGPEFESVVLLGSNCGIFDLEIVTEANYLCNLYGLDTMSAGATISCAMELSEKGIIDEPEIKFGNADILKKLVKMIAYKEGIGAEMAEGSYRFAEKHGHADLSMSVKKMELAAYDPRGAYGHALGYATSNRGACHLNGYLIAMEIYAAPKKIPQYTTASKADLLVLKQHQSVCEDSLVVCKFAGWAIGFDFYARFATYVTGHDYDVKELMKIGERVYNLERLYNIREGMSAKDDTLPPRFLKEAFTKGKAQGRMVPLEPLIKDYYAIREWDKDTSLPSKSKLEFLGLTLLKGMENMEAK